MRVLILQHAEGEWVGSMADWFAAKHAELVTVRMDLNHALPDITEFDWLVIMGGPMGVYDEAGYPWLVEEKALVKQAITLGKTVLGICLGAQLIASAMGAQVKPNSQPEIGWFNVRKCHSAAIWLPDQCAPLSWHSDVVELPPGAVILASSAITPIQGFMLEPRVVGLQFHLEAEPETAQAFLRLETQGLPLGQWVQSTHQLLNNNQGVQESRPIMHRLLESLLAASPQSESIANAD